MDIFLNDVRHAARLASRSPCWLWFALGIRTSTPMFTVLETVLVDRLPIAEQDRVVVMHALEKSGRDLDVPESYFGIEAYRHERR